MLFSILLGGVWMQGKQPNRGIYQFLKVVLIEPQKTSIQRLGVMMGAAHILCRTFSILKAYLGVGKNNEGI